MLIAMHTTAIEAAIATNVITKKSTSVTTKPKTSVTTLKTNKKETLKTKSPRTETKPVNVSRGSSRDDVEATVREVGNGYWPEEDQLDALVWIYKHECVKPGVVSKGGYQGLFQLGNPPDWMVLGDAASEAKAGCEYIKRRYKTPLSAKAFWLKHHWY
jgi:hypothetical protein